MVPAGAHPALVPTNGPRRQRRLISRRSDQPMRTTLRASLPCGKRLQKPPRLRRALRRLSGLATATRRSAAEPADTRAPRPARNRPSRTRRTAKLFALLWNPIVPVRALRPPRSPPEHDQNPRRSSSTSTRPDVPTRAQRRLARLRNNQVGPDHLPRPRRRCQRRLHLLQWRRRGPARARWPATPPALLRVPPALPRLPPIRRRPPRLTALAIPPTLGRQPRPWRPLPLPRAMRLTGALVGSSAPQHHHLCSERGSCLR
mmetsp:Transcript_17559/g.66372  ORF Transcript_17559/g.66372 Transcript_17559/m.66372 type:complete len:259 (+) Transcript_17559:465-1241(+)